MQISQKFLQKFGAYICGCPRMFVDIPTTCMKGIGPSLDDSRHSKEPLKNKN